MDKGIKHRQHGTFTKDNFTKVASHKEIGREKKYPGRILKIFNNLPLVNTLQKLP